LILRGSAIANYAPFIGLRYSFSRKRNRFTSVIAMVSMLGMVVGVASVVAVLSIMNGFAGELRGRILSLVPHGYVMAREQGISDWQALLPRLLDHPGVEGASPYISDKVIFKGSRVLRGGQLTAIDPVLEQNVSGLSQEMVRGELESLQERAYNVVLGAPLARLLGVGLGDYIEVTVPRLNITPLGVFPRSKRLTVTGMFEIGAQPDSYQGYISLDVGQRLLRRPGVIDGFQVRTTDLFAAPQIMAALETSLAGPYQIKDWSQTQGSLFSAVKMENVMVSLLLLSVVAVAAFNIVSTLVMSVVEKRRDIAVLRTMGARASGVMTIFIAHGMWLATVGISAGALFGVLIALYVPEIASFLENLLGLKLFDPSVYFISELPSRLMWSDVGWVVSASVALSLLATLYPAWRASRIAPAEVLRYE
jgi:lipoprotein-releasing system permease protein